MLSCLCALLSLYVICILLIPKTLACWTMHIWICTPKCWTMCDVAMNWWTCSCMFYYVDLHDWWLCSIWIDDIIVAWPICQFIPMLEWSSMWWPRDPCSPLPIWNVADAGVPAGIQYPRVAGTGIVFHPSRVAGAGTGLRIASRVRVCRLLTRG